MLKIFGLGAGLPLRHSLLAAVVVWCSVDPTLLTAQADTARLTGTVHDSSGAVIPNASVRIDSRSTGRGATATTGDDGEFNFPGLAVGDYTIRVELTGFKAYNQSVHLDPGQVANAPITLENGSLTETVEVTEQAALVESASSDVGATIQGRQVTELPLNGRNFTQLATLVPGVTRGLPQGQGTGANGNAETFRYGNVGGASLAVNGLPPQANNFLLDGLDNNETLVNSITFFPPAEAIQEFRVETSVAPAQFGRAGGAIVNTSIKSGTNSLHGSAFEFLRNSELDARPTFASARAPFRRNQFGGTLGFPVLKNKFFLFGDYQGLRQSLPLGTDFVTVPTAAFRGGDYSVLLNPAQSGLSQAYQLRDPLTGAAYPNNQIPASAINQVGQRYLNAFPLPNIGGKVQQNYQTQRNQVQQFDDFDVRGDFLVSEHDQLFGRFSFNQDSSTTSSRFPNLPAGFGSGANFAQPRGFVLGETHTFAPSLINELRAGFQRQYFGYTPPLNNRAVSSGLGIPNANTSPLLGGGALIGGGGSQIEYTGDFGAYLVPQNTYEISDALTIVTGQHTVKLGTQIIWRQVNLFRPRAGKGFFNLFSNGQGPGSTGYEPADILAGFLNNYQIGAQTGYFGDRSWENGFFVQDDWRVTQRLTINAGLRYDILTWTAEQFNRQSDFDLATGQLLLAGRGGQRDSLAKNDYNNFGPRLGFAFSLTNDAKTVLRGGYGLFYFLDRGGIDNQLAQNPPFSGIAQYNYTDGFHFTLSGAAPSLTSPPASATGPLPPPGFLSGFNPARPQNISPLAVLLNNRTSYIQEYNLQVQRQLFRDAVFTLGYVGTLGRKLPFYYDANQQVFGGFNGQRAYPSLGSVTTLANRGRSNYNSLQAQFEKRLSRGFQFRASYTFSRLIDDGDGAFDAPRPQDIRNFEAERALANIDQKNVFVASSLYELPVGRGRLFGSNWSRPLDLVLGGWQVNGIWTWASGLPFNITQNGNQRPDVSGPIKTFTGSTQRYFDTSGFALVPTVNNGVYVRPGGLGRNPLRGPGYNNLDLSIFKDFALTERIKLQFRSEFYNIANHPRYGNPDSNVTDGNFGRINSTILASERQIQFAARVSF